jgi:hypothetical protein
MIWPARWVRRFLQGRQQRLFRQLPALDAGHHATAVIVDGGQWLVQLMRHARRHFAHGDQAADRLGAFCLARGQFFGLAARSDVGGNHHLGQPPVHPVQVA